MLKASGAGGPAQLQRVRPRPEIPCHAAQWATVPLHVSGEWAVDTVQHHDCGGLAAACLWHSS